MKNVLNLRTLQSCCPDDKSSYKYRLKHFEQANNADLLLLLMSKLSYYLFVRRTVITTNKICCLRITKYKIQTQIHNALILFVYVDKINKN